MATVITSMSAANLAAAAAAADGGWSLSSALSWSAAAYDNAYYYDVATYSTTSPSFVAGRLSNGDSISATGSNLTGSTNTITRLDYYFSTRGVNVSLFGNVAISANGSQSGYLNKVTVSSTDYGSITILGYDDVASYSPTSISSFTTDFNGLHASASGSFTGSTSVVGGYYETTLSGSCTSFAFTYGGQSMQLSNISFPVNSSFTGAADELAYVLSGNDTIAGSNGNELLTGYAGNDSINGDTGTDTAIFSGNLSTYTLTRSASTYTVRANSGSDGTDTLTNIERLQFIDATIDLMPLTLYANRVQEFYLAWTGNALSGAELARYAADYAEIAATGKTIYNAAIYLEHGTLSNPNLSGFDYGQIITTMYENLTGSTDVPQEMYDLFMSRLGVSWDATKLAVKMIKSAGFWANTDGTFGKPPGFTAFDFTADAASDAGKVQATLASHATFDLTADALVELTLVGVSG